MAQGQGSPEQIIMAAVYLLNCYAQTFMWINLFLSTTYVVGTTGLLEENSGSELLNVRYLKARTDSGCSPTARVLP